DVPPGPVNSYHTVDPPWANAQNTPFRKYKRWDQEGGISTPLIARWPGHITGGEITHQPGHIIDIMATCVDLAGATYPATFQGQAIPPLEGQSLAPIFRGDTRKGHDAIYWQYGRTKAIRQGQWKLVQVDDDPWELYDMAADRTELHNLAGQQLDRVRAMVRRYAAWAERTGAKV
ncbi:MAG TPA: sulfatase/phosphatase domain-containing protein, partial [Gammaproteobacteria bacterium]|nr:sulfatase/phosphatase domain-containing protein [Gammaproteobacteria bacterium]